MSAVVRVDLVKDADEATSHKSNIDAMDLAELVEHMMAFGALAGLGIPENSEAEAFCQQRGDGQYVAGLDTIGGIVLGFVKFDSSAEES